MFVEQTGEGTLEITSAISILQTKIAGAGLRLKESSDFTLFEDTIRATEDRYLMEDFSSRFFDLHGAMAFWIGAWDEKGEPVSVQAAKVEDLKDRSLGDFWRQQQRRMFVDPAPNAELGEEHAHDAFYMRGRIVYHGNLWLRRDARGQARGGSDAARLSGIASEMVAGLSLRPHGGKKRQERVRNSGRLPALCAARNPLDRAAGAHPSGRLAGLFDQKRSHRTCQDYCC